MTASPDWKKLYTAFDPFRPLPANDPAWVDCAAVRGEEDILAGLGLEIARSEKVTCQLYAGHRGAGKSTELLRLQDHLQGQGFRVVYFAADDGDLEPENTQYSDILLACARQLISKLRSQSGQDDKFREWVDRLLRDLRDLGVTELSLDELSYETPETPLGKISATIKTNVSKQQVIRRQVEQQAESLIDILNEFIGSALGDRKPQDLVLIVDNLDRIIERYEGENQPSNYEQIFVNHSDQLRALNCHVIYTVPISLAYSVHLTAMEERYKPVEVLPMIMLKTPEGEISEIGMAKLKELIRQRFRFAHMERELEAAFESIEALNKLCEMSGGNIRDLMHLMKAALQHTRKLPISTRSVQRAISELRDTYRKVIDGHEWEALVRVSQDKLITENSDQFRRLLFRRCILEYRYVDGEGGVQWHDAHPLLWGLDSFKQALDRYEPGEPVKLRKMGAAALDWDADVVADPEESYQSLVRSLSRTEGFSLFFVHCLPGDQWNLVGWLEAELPTLLMQRLDLKEELVDGNLYQRVATLPNLQQINVLFISGLEKSLDPYVKSGYGGQGDYYNLDTVPRVLGHLNLQRERFRDDFPFCFVFFLSTFGIKYTARRAPDFFDWRSGIFDIWRTRRNEFIPDSEIIGKLTQELQGNYQEYLAWSHTQRLDRICDIQGILEEDQQTPNQQASLLWEKGNILAADRNYEVAIASYNKALEIKPDLHEAWSNRGNALYNLGREEEAIASYDKALEIEPEDHHAWSNRGNALYDLSPWKEAIASYDKALEIKPDLHGVWYIRGLVLSCWERDDEAIASYDKALEIKPDLHGIWNNRGSALYNSCRWEEAIASYDKALETKPDDPYAWSNRGDALEEAWRWEEAVGSCDKALEIEPEDRYTWCIRGTALSRLCRWEEAIASYDKALEIKPDDKYGWNSRAFALSALGRYTEAITSYDHALEVKPNDYRDSPTWHSRGNTLMSLECYEEAIASFDRAVEISPNWRHSWISRAVALMQLRQFEAAHKSFEAAHMILDQALLLSPDDASVHYNKACYYGLQQDIDLAIATLQQAINLDSKYREMAKTDSDFDGIRQDDRFQSLIGA